MSVVRHLKALTSATVCSALAIIFAISANSLSAQSAQRYSLQVSGIHVGVFGDAYEGLKAGIGGEAQIRFTPGVWSFGLGAQMSKHGSDMEDFSDYNVDLAGVFFEPRRIIDVGSKHVAPYISARLAYLQQSTEVDVYYAEFGESTVKAKASGSQINGGGGLLFRMSSRVNLDLGVTYGLIRFGDPEYEISGQGKVKLDQGGANGQNLVLRAGLAIGLGK